MPIKKKGEKYGPYGTQWLYDKQLNDIWTDLEKQRVEKFNKLRATILPEQRTPEWFTMREGCISASDGGTVVNVNPYELPYRVIFKKVAPNLLPFESSEPCYHGKKLEQIATSIYEYRMNVKVDDFGLMKHQSITFLGASPDGIISHYKLDGKTKTKFVGRMLEIKCPASRKINHEGPEMIYDKHNYKNGICPPYYWVQVQLQLECCDLDECDFWQCNIKEYVSREEFIADTHPKEPHLSKTTGFEKGCLIELIPKSSVARSLLSKKDLNSVIWDVADWIHPPSMEMDPLDCDEWIAREIANLHNHPKYKNYVLYKIHYWYLVNSKCITIKRDRDWFAKNLPIFGQVWNNILYLRQNPEIFKLIVNYANYLEPINERPYRRTKQEKQEGENINTSIMSIINILCDTNNPNYDLELANLKIKMENVDKVNVDKVNVDKVNVDKVNVDKLNNQYDQDNQELELTLKQELLGMPVNSCGSAFVD